MAESREGTSISVNPKEKKSLLDEEIGKDFLSSWKSMSVTEDDAMDFSFDTVSNGKKKFNFDKLEVDFNLDGDFDKLSSFKMDMPDLDFSCSSKRTVKSKERTEEDASSRNHQGKKDLFSFSFDFNDEDITNDVQIGSKLVGNTKSSTKELTDELFSLRSEKNVNSPRKIRDGFGSDDEHNGSKLFGESSPQDKQVTQGEPAMLVEKNSGREDFNASDAQISSELVENSESLTTELSEGEPVLLRSENNVNNLSDVREDIESNDAQSESKLSTESKPQDKQVTQGGPFLTESKRDAGEDFNTNEVQISNKLVGPKSLSRSTELGKNESFSLESAKDAKNLGNISREGINADGERNGSKIVGNSKPQEKEATIEVPVTLRSEKSTGFQVNLSSSTEKNKSTTEASGDPKFVISSTQSISNVKNDSVEGTKTGKRAPDLSISTEKKRISSGKASQNLKFVVSSMQAIRNVKNDSIEGTKSEKGIPDLSGSTEKMSKSTTEASGNLKFVVSSMQAIRNVDNDSVEGIKIGKRTPDLSSSTEKTSTSSTEANGAPKLVVSSMKNVSVEGIKTVKRAPDLSSLNTFRTTGRNKEVPNSTVLRQGNSFRNSEQNTKLLANMTTNITLPSGGSEKQKPLTTVSLKRKKIEESNAELVSLKSHKRLSESPKESRYFKESSGRVVEEKGCNDENQTHIKTKNIFHDNSTSGLEVSREINTSELEISVGMENDGNVERAEAYTKELEDICNMLKKKHEEAKELLVRAIVNNNNLLMLNHPMHEEKIRMVQKFATQLTFKEVAN